MTERIKGLERQAWEHVDATWDWTNPDHPTKATLFTTKFAELIINECAAVVTLWSDEEPCSEGYDIHTVHKMKEHFGVTSE